MNDSLPTTGGPSSGYEPNFCLKFHSQIVNMIAVFNHVSFGHFQRLQVMVFTGSLLLLVYKDLYI